MRKLLSFFFFLVGVSGISLMHAQKAWHVVGSAGFSAGQISYPSLAIDGNGTPYVVYRDGGNSCKATVMKYDGSSWVTVGSAGFSLGEATLSTLAIDGNGIPYVAYLDDNNDFLVTVMKYDGSSWVTVGSSGFSLNPANYISLAIDGNNTPYVSYIDGSTNKVTVKKFNEGWASVGGATAVISGDAFYTSLAFDASGAPYVAYKDVDNFGKATVKKYEDGIWFPIGTAGFSEASVNYISLAIDDSGTPYVAYEDAGNSNKVTVKKYDGSSWVTVGTAGFSAHVAIDISLAIDDSGTPYVAYKDGVTNMANVMMYNGSSWVVVGSENFSPDWIAYASFAIDRSGKPYMAFMDWGNGLKATVMKYSYIPPKVTAVSPASGLPAGGTSVTINGSFFLEATDVHFGTKAATSFTVNSSTSITAISPAGSLGTVDITVTTPGGTSATSTADQFSYRSAQTITFNALSAHTYGDNSFTLSATGGASGNPVVFTSSDPTVATCSGTNGTTVTLLKAGSCTITANQAGNDSYLDASSVSQSLTVSARPITVTVNAGQNKSYGRSDAPFTYLVTPALLSGDVLTGALTRAAGESLGTYAITQGTLSGGVNYAITFIGANYTITREMVAVTANPSQGKFYGQSDAALTYSFTPALQSGNGFTGALTRATGESSGKYAITQGTLSAGANYIINFIGADYTIAPQPVTVTANASQGKVYGQKDAVLTYTFTPALQAGDAFTGELGRSTGESVGTYGITKGTLSAGPNYIINFTGANYTITSLPITVKADAGLSKMYGTTDPVLTYTVTPELLNGDVFTGALGRSTGENVGTYAINKGTLSAGSNYLLAFEGSSFTITPAEYTISGNVGVAGATLSYFNETDETVVAASDGSYSITVPAYWSGTVTPSLEGYRFSTHKEYSNVSTNLSNQNYTATDIVPPTMNLTSNSTKGAVKAGDIITFTATFSDANGISENPGPTITIGSVIVNASMSKSSNLVWTYAWTVPASINATVPVSVKATDPAGNQVIGGIDITSYNIDNTSPAVTFTGIIGKTSVHVFDEPVIDFSEPVVQVASDLASSMIVREGGKSGIDIPFTVRTVSSSGGSQLSSRSKVISLKSIAVGKVQIVLSVTFKCSTTYYLALKAGTFADVAGNLLPLSENTFTTDPNPAKPVIAGAKATMCAGDLLTCSNADGTLAYTWKKDGNDISGASATTYVLPDNVAGTYSLQVTNTATTCTSVSDASSIAQYPIVTPVVYEKKQSGVVSILVVSNTNNSFSGYKWTYADGSALPSSMATTNQFLVLKPENMNASYLVTATDTNGCKRSSASKTVSLRSANLLVYPTVSNQSFNVSYVDTENGQVEIRVVNTKGEIIQKLQVKKSSMVETYSLNLGSVPSGVYYIELQMGDFKDTKRVIINR